MRHHDPNIQDIVEAVQGALRMVSDRPIIWRVRESLGAYQVDGLLVGGAVSYSVGFTVSKLALGDQRYHQQLRQNIVYGVLKKIADDSRPAPEEEVRYHVTEVMS